VDHIISNACLRPIGLIKQTLRNLTKLLNNYRQEIDAPDFHHLTTCGCCGAAPACDEAAGGE
jgi:hypothetical protein